MSSKTIAIAYCTDNKDVVADLEKNLAEVNYKVNHLPCQSAKGLKIQVVQEKHPIVLLISDNFLKSTDCMHESLAMIQHLNAQKKFLPIITAGRYKNAGGNNYRVEPTTFERVSNVIQYMNYWQDAYLALRRKKRQTEEEEDGFNENLKRVRTISSEVGEFLRYLRNTAYVSYETLEETHYEDLFKLASDQATFFEFKNKNILGNTTISSAIAPETVPLVEEEVVVEITSAEIAEVEDLISEDTLVSQTELDLTVNRTEIVTKEVAINGVTSELEDLTHDVEENVEVTTEVETNKENIEAKDIEETVPAGALMMEEVTDNVGTEQAGVPESVEKGIEAIASNGVMEAFQNGMDEFTQTAKDSKANGISTPTIETDDLPAGFDMNAIPGINQLNLHQNDLSISENEEISASKTEEEPLVPNGETLESLIEERGKEEKLTPNFGQILKETIAEENRDPVDEVQGLQDNITSFDELFQEEEVSEETSPRANNNIGTIEALMENVEPEKKVEEENIVSKPVLDEVLKVEDDNVLDDLMENPLEEEEILPTTLEQIVAKDVPVVQESVEEKEEAVPTLEEVVALQEEPVTINLVTENYTDTEEEEGEEPIMWNDVVEGIDNQKNIEKEQVVEEEESEPIKWDDLVAATEEQMQSEKETLSENLATNKLATEQNIAKESEVESIPQPVFTPVVTADVIAIANEYFSHGQNSKGLSCYRKALQKKPINTTLRYHYAVALMRQANDFQGASEELETLLGYDEKHEDAYFLLAALAEMQGDFVQAKTYYEKVAALNEDYLDIDYRLGIVALSQPEREEREAAQYFKNAIKKNSMHADAYYQLALLLKNYVKKPAKAVKFFEKALSINTQHDFANYDLAMTQEQLGNRPAATIAYRKAIAINPELRTDGNDKLFLPIEEQASKFTEMQQEIQRLEDLIQRRAEEQTKTGDTQITPAQEVAVELEKPVEPGKVVFITGATSGIGRATAELFARNGYRLILTGRRTGRLKALQAHFEESYKTAAQILPFDVRNVEEVKAAIEKLDDEWRQIDILINNAGLASGFGPIHEGDLNDWETMIDTNLKGLLYMTRAIAPHMVARKSGHIINIGSIAGKEAYPNGNVYNATKFAVDGLTKAMRLDLYQHNIRVSQVAPGHVEETEFALVRFHGDQERAKIYEGFKPLTSSDVADTIYFIATRPPHVNIQDVLLMGTQQGSATNVDRSGR